MEFSAEEPQLTLTSSPVPFCAFCLREQPINVEFYKHIVGSTAELRHSFQSMLGYDFQLANFSICKPCWKLMQLVQDFRLRCFKANNLVERIGQGLRCEDGWFSVKNLAIIESVRMMIKDQVQQIGIEEELRATDVTNDQNLDHDMEGELVSTIEFSGFKIESVESLVKEDLAKDEMKTASNEQIVELSEQSCSEQKCSKCGKTFALKKSFKLHIAKCNGTTACQICSATFTQHYQFEAHMNKHEGKTPYNCRKNCTKGFTSKPYRKAHEAKCAKDERQCNLCEEKLFTEERLTEHYEQVHPQEKKYPCKLCSTRFSREPCLKTHMQTKHGETGPKTFPCPICGKQFTVRYNIRPHIEQVHGQKRNFQCEICKKRFTTRNNLQEHVARVHPEAASDCARELLDRKQARTSNANRKVKNFKNNEKTQQTLFDFKGFTEG